MIKLVSRNFHQAEWNEIVSSFDDLSLMQTWEYADAKAQNSSWKIERAVLVDAERTVGAVQAMVRLAPWRRQGLVWISRGPLWNYGSEASAEAVLPMLEALRQHWVTDRGMYLRLMPTFREGELTADSLSRIGYGLAPGSVKWSSTVVDLSQSQETLRSNLQQKWRNCLNKAEKQAMTLESGDSQGLFEEVISEYQQMLQDKGFTSVVTPELLTQLQARLPESRRLWSLVAKRDKERVGAVLIARFGKSCEYLVGAVNDKGKAMNAGQWLLWHAICDMKEMGLHWFDVGGTDPSRTPKGILHFKQGLGGRSYELGHEMEAYKPSLVARAIRWRVTRERQAK